jgi:hypothetical protein
MRRIVNESELTDLNNKDACLYSLRGMFSKKLEANSRLEAITNSDGYATRKLHAEGVPGGGTV